MTSHYRRGNSDVLVNPSWPSRTDRSLQGLGAW